MQSQAYEALCEALECVDGMTADVRGGWPVGLIRVRHLLVMALAEVAAPGPVAVVASEDDAA